MACRIRVVVVIGSGTRRLDKNAAMFVYPHV